MLHEFKTYKKTDEDTHIIETECDGRKYYGEWRETVRFGNSDTRDDVYDVFEECEFDNPFACRFEVPEHATSDQIADIFNAFMRTIEVIESFEDGDEYNYDHEREQAWKTYYHYVDHVMSCEVVDEAA